MGKTLTWEELDRCETADEIANLLRRLGIRGSRDRSLHSANPLARATGYLIYYEDDDAYALGDGDDDRDLTDAECDFVRRFYHGVYPDLEESCWDEGAPLTSA